MTGRSIVKSPTECGVSECDLEAPPSRRRRPELRHTKSMQANLPSEVNRFSGTQEFPESCGTYLCTEEFTCTPIAHFSRSNLTVHSPPPPLYISLSSILIFYPYLTLGYPDGSIPSGRPVNTSVLTNFHPLSRPPHRPLSHAILLDAAGPTGSAV